MGSLGWPETVFIFVLALLVFGPKKLPELGRNLAKAMNQFKKASSDLRETWHREMAAIERETQSIKDEAHKLIDTPELNELSQTDLGYDSSYEYGSYSYPDSYDSTTTTSTADAEAAAADGSGAAQTDAAGQALDEASQSLASAEEPVKAVTPEGVVPVEPGSAAPAPASSL
jgi:sec-independent protein translocase protein TatA